MKRQLFLISIVIFGILLLSGCQKPEGSSNGSQPISPNPPEKKAELTLYFLNQEKYALIPEKREVLQSGQSIEELAVAELIKGPENKELLPTVPKDTKLLSLSIEDNTAYVNFSKEYDQPRDLNAESLYVLSVVNTLTEFAGIQKVQILVEGDKDAANLSSFYLAEPQERNETWIDMPGHTVIKPMDPRIGEDFVEGLILKVDRGNKTIEIEQYIADANDKIISPRVKIADDAVLQLNSNGKTKDTTWDEIKTGRDVALILTKDGTARAVIVNVRS
jgi:hypothetical protein